MGVTLHGPDGTGAAPVAPQQPTPSQRIVAEGNALRSVTDTKGRKIGYRRLKALERFRMTDALGPDRSRNETLSFMAEVACSVRDIDGDAVSMPRNYLQIEAMIQRLDDEGMGAVMQDMADVVRAQQAEGEQSDLDRAKNSPGTVE